MTTLLTHAPGTFCWPELSTSDQNAAKKFYSALFGWTVNDSPMGPDAVYTIFQRDGKDAAACATLMPEAKAQGVPPNWMAYLTVANADDTVKKAAQLGGKVLKDAFDVMDHGRMAVIQDPTGATFCVWQGKNHNGAGILNEPGALCWTELVTSDTSKAGPFYKSLFGWGGEDMPMGPMVYTLFKRGDKNAGGMMAMPAEMKGAPSSWMSYFEVTNCDQSAEKVKQLGGTVMVPPTDIPMAGRFAVISDPQGAMFGILQSAQKG
jgi:predicted enzyme related to lactoylglutathione lyase